MRTFQHTLKLLTLSLGLASFSMPSSSAVIELGLVLDGSASISANDFQLQKDAYSNIFGSGTFYDTFLNDGDQLWVSAWQFSSFITLEQDWFLIDSNEAATTFGQTFSDISQINFGTNTSTATVVVAENIAQNSIVSDSAIIDISTDGIPFLCAPNCFGQSNDNDAAIAAAAYANSLGVTVNAIGVGDALTAAEGEAFLNSFTTAGGGFYELASSFDVFEDALASKLFREISGGDAPDDDPVDNGGGIVEVNEPTTLSLLAISLMGIAMLRRRQSLNNASLVRAL